MATVTTFSFGFVVKKHISAGESLRAYGSLLPPLSPPLPGCISTSISTLSVSPPSFHFYLTSSNYFRVIPASRLYTDKTKPDALPTDSSTTQPQPEVGLYVANNIAAAIASGSNRAGKGCLLREGRSYIYTSTEQCNIFGNYQTEPLCVT